MQSSGTRQAVVIGGLMVLFGVLLLIQEFVEISAWIWTSLRIRSSQPM
jgi:dipeptide/tripeptide permease